MIRAWVFVLALTGPVFAQSVDIRVTGEHRATSRDTAEVAAQLALVDAQAKAVREAASRLRGAPDVVALKLAPGQLEALTATLLDLQPQTARVSGGIHQAEALLRFDATDAIQRIKRMRTDQDATGAAVLLWEQQQALHASIADETLRLATAAPVEQAAIARQRQVAVVALQVKQLSAKVTAALARVEESAVSGRVIAPDGRERAETLAVAALALAPNSPDAHMAMGDALMAARRVPAAEAEYRAVVLAQNDSAQEHIKLAAALTLQQKQGEAIGELREALRIDPASVRAHTSLASALRAQRNTTEALPEYREALRLDPDYVEAHNGLALIYAGQGQLPEAIAEFREIVRIDPDSAIGYYNLSFALAEMDQDEESAAALREVIRINPNHYTARYNLGEMFRLEGKFDESAKQFREYLRLAPDTPANQRNIERAKNFVASFENR